MLSVILPTYNRSGIVSRAIKSVVSQSFKDIELIIIDDGSEDDTERSIKSHADKRIKYFKQANKGPGSARNRGILLSKGEYLAFLDSDDWWDKEKLSIQMKAMLRDKNCLISHTQEIWYRNGKLLNQKTRHRKFNGFIFDKCLPLCAVGMSTVPEIICAKSLGMNYAAVSVISNVWNKNHKPSHKEVLELVQKANKTIQTSQLKPLI